MAIPDVPSADRPAPAPRSRRAFLATSGPRTLDAPLSGTYVPRQPADAKVSSRAPDPDGRHWVRIQRRAMACRFEITLDDRDARFIPAAKAAFDGIEAIETQLTVFRDTSEVVHINRHAAFEDVPVDDSLFDLLTRCRDLSAATGGAFDITSMPLSRCWGFLRREGRLPSPEEIAASRAMVGMEHVRLDGARTTISFDRHDTELNFGAVGKGYALDRVARALRAAGVTHALLSAGQSSLLAIGGRAGGWKVDLASPRRARPIARVRLRDAALGTSGAGEQYTLAEGRRYGHVLDPRTGWPAEGVLSSSVVCDSAADADALSTAFLVGGPSLAERYCKRHPATLVLITPDDGSGRTFVIGRHERAEVEER